MDNDRYLTLATEGHGVLREKASRFLAWAFPVQDEDEFKQRVQRIANEHHTSRHVCYAWILGARGDRHRANDAGEPSGTAGRPILNRLQGAGLTNAAVVVIRYFGGTLLGKAGLVKAYGDTAQLALDQTTMIERVLREEVIIRCTYAQLEAVRNTVLKFDGKVLQEQFAEGCEVIAALPKSRVADQLQAWHAMGLHAQRNDQGK